MAQQRGLTKAVRCNYHLRFQLRAAGQDFPAPLREDSLKQPVLRKSLEVKDPAGLEDTWEGFEWQWHVRACLIQFKQPIINGWWKTKLLTIGECRSVGFFLAGALFFKSMSLCLIVVFAHNIFKQSQLQCAQLCWGARTGCVWVWESASTWVMKQTCLRLIKVEKLVSLRPCILTVAHNMTLRWLPYLIITLSLIRRTADTRFLLKIQNNWGLAASLTLGLFLVKEIMKTDYNYDRREKSIL